MRAFLWSALVCSLLAQNQTANEQAVRDVHVRLSIKDGKTNFRSGEPIRLVMSFTADRPGYSLPQEQFEQPVMPYVITISPDAGVFRPTSAPFLEDTLRDAIFLRPLSTQPLEIVVALNWWVRFDDAGDYTVRTNPAIALSNGGNVGITSNPVSFHVERMSDEDETTEVRRLKALMNAPDKSGSLAARDACEDLLFLPGDAAAQEKANLLLNPVPFQPCSANAQFGLYLSRNPEHVASLLEQRLKEKTASLVSWNIDQVSAFRVWSELPSLIAQAQGDDAALHRLEEARIAELRRDRIREIADRLADLPLDARRRVALELTKGPGPMPPAAHDVLIDQFDALTPDEQLTLALTRWQELNAPATVLPVVRQAATSPAGSDDADRQHALAVLLELSPAEGLSRLLADVIDSRSGLQPQTFRLPNPCLMAQIDRPLVSLLTELASSHSDEAREIREAKAMWLARCGTGAVQKDIRRLYDDERLGKGTRAYLLAYLAKWNEQEAAPLITRAAASGNAEEELYWRITTFTYPRVVDGLLRSDLESNDISTAGPAAYQLAEHGPAETRAVLEARLARWIKEWGARRAEVEAEEMNSGSNSQSGFQTALINAILHAQSWKLTDAEALALRQTCLTARCRQFVDAR